jgi:hypothetical protein
MRANYWIVFKGPAKIVAFAALSIPIVWFCAQLPPEAWEGGRRRRFSSLPLVMVISWIVGWFMVWFVKAEDTHVLAPFDFQGLTRVIGAFLIVLGFGIAVLFYLTFF